MEDCTADVRRRVAGVLNKLAEQTAEKTAENTIDLYAEHRRQTVTDAVSDTLTRMVSRSEPLQEKTRLAYGMFLFFVYHKGRDEILFHFLQRMLLALEEREEGHKTQNIAAVICTLNSFGLFPLAVVAELCTAFLLSQTDEEVETIYFLFRHSSDEIKADRRLWATVRDRLEKRDDARRNYFVQEIKDDRTGGGNSEETGRVLRLQEIFLRRERITRKEVPVVPLERIREGQCREWRAERDTAQGKTDMNRLCERMKMNTEVKRGIFRAVMLADDADAAYSRIASLGLGEKQKHDVGMVIVRCVLAAKDPNMFFSHLADRLCRVGGTKRQASEAKGHRVSFRCCLWDQIREMDGYSERKMKNITLFYGGLFSEGHLPLSGLKSVVFEDPSPNVFGFVKSILFEFIEKSSEEVLAKGLSTLKHAGKSEMATLYRNIRNFIRGEITEEAIEEAFGDRTQRVFFAKRLCAVKKIIDVAG
ncbi:MAG: putative nucleolar MIF4G domain-containing protein 1 [Amphiamblys sp. WSBS2006]|nr:MAG: putative nucleolar MIF4G domain-containing protein 1 [Amphiamblys sp. WSBS2006]